MGNNTLKPITCEGIRYLSCDDLTFINRHLIQHQTPKEPIGVYAPDALASSQQSPAHHAYYEQVRDVYELASVLMSSLIWNHPFRNANKRTAFAAGVIFLYLNGYELQAKDDEEEAVLLMAGIATGDYSREDLENWLAYNSAPLPASRLDNPIDSIKILETRILIS